MPRWLAHPLSSAIHDALFAAAPTQVAEQRKWIEVPSAKVAGWFSMEGLMKTLFASAVGSVSLVTSGVALAQSGNMMNGGGWGMDWMGGYGGIWGPILLVVAIVAIVALVMQRKGK